MKRCEAPLDAIYKEVTKSSVTYFSVRNSVVFSAWRFFRGLFPWPFFQWRFIRDSCTCKRASQVCASLAPQLRSPSTTLNLATRHHTRTSLAATQLCEDVHAVALRSDRRVLSVRHKTKTPNENCLAICTCFRPFSVYIELSMR